MKHTSRAWYVSSTGNHQGLIINEVDGRNVAVTYDSKDAHLIATAPDMLEALIEAKQRLVSFIMSQCECDNTHEQNDIVCCLCEIDLVITKAKGQ